MLSASLLIIASQISRTICKCPNPVGDAYWQFDQSSPYIAQKDITSGQAVISPEDSNEMYHICFRDWYCHEPKLTIDFDTISFLNTSAKISFYIWKPNIFQYKRYSPMITHYTTADECDLNVVKRIIKTSEADTQSWNEKWAVVDSQYNMESRPLSDKAIRDVGIVIIVDPEGPLHATVTLNCSDSFDWSFDFEDSQTLVTFTVALSIFCVLWSISICCIRYDELKEQYTSTGSNTDGNLYANLCMFGCGRNEQRRCYLFISHSDDNNPLANTWLYYVMGALLLSIYAVLLTLYGDNFVGCYFVSLLLFTSAILTSAFLMDLSCCQARWFGKCECSDGNCHCGVCIQKPLCTWCMSGHVCMRGAFRRWCPYIWRSVTGSVGSVFNCDPLIQNMTLS
eukprot:823666_1